MNEEFNETEQTDSGGWQTGEGTWQTNNTAEQAGYSAEQANMEAQTVSKPIKSNIVSGLVGAFIGSLLGVALWILIYKLGYIAGIAGALIVIASMRGYEILGKGLDRKGVVLCTILSLIMVFIANKLSWSMEAYIAFKEQGVGVSFFDIYRNLNNLLKEFEITSSYYKDLAIGYTLFIIAGVSDIVRAFRNAKRA